MTDSPRGDAGDRIEVKAPGAISMVLAKLKPRFDPLFWTAVFAFAVAAGAAAYPAFRTDPGSAPGLLLLIGVAGVTALALFAMAPRREAPAVLDYADLVMALDEPAAVASPDGRVFASNLAWRAIGADPLRLPRGRDASGLFAAFATARRGDAGRALLRFGPLDLEAVVTAFPDPMFLVRACALEALAPTPPKPAPAAPVSAGPDGFAQAAPFGAAALDGDDPFAALVVEANGALIAMAAGRSPVGRPFADLFDAQSREEAATRIGPTQARELELAGPAPRRVVHLYLSRDGERRLAYLVDVTERKQLENHLRQAQKMQAIGQLAGGVAHDFNNLLSAIQLRLDELLHTHPVGDPSYEGLNEIRQTGARAADLVRKLLAFSRKQTVRRETIELGELISEFEVLLRRLLREDVRLQTAYGRDLPRVHADKSQLEMAVMNLAVNARDAMRDQGGGVLTIRTGRIDHAQAVAFGWTDAPKGDCALIEVSDTGPGMSAEVAAKAFEPFFTTKAVGEGTGMGLATVYGIVEQAEGYVALETAPGEGACFRILLPEHHGAVEAAAEPQRPERAPARDLSGAGKILFVEDEDAVRGVAARLLRARGYEVIEACDGDEALALAEANAGHIDMLISDVIMPGMDGPSLLRRARPYLGEAPVMFISGYAEAEFSDLLEGESGVSFLPKPIDIKTLAERVKKELRAA